MKTLLEMFLAVKDELPDFATKIGFWVAVFALIYTILIHHN